MRRSPMRLVVLVAMAVLAIVAVQVHAKLDASKPIPVPAWLRHHSARAIPSSEARAEVTQATPTVPATGPAEAALPIPESHQAVASISVPDAPKVLSAQLPRGAFPATAEQLADAVPYVPEDTTVTKVNTPVGSPAVEVEAQLAEEDENQAPKPAEAETAFDTPSVQATTMPTDIPEAGIEPAQDAILTPFELNVAKEEGIETEERPIPLEGSIRSDPMPVPEDTPATPSDVPPSPEDDEFTLRVMDIPSFSSEEVESAQSEIVNTLDGFLASMFGGGELNESPATSNQQVEEETTAIPGGFMVVRRFGGPMFGEQITAEATETTTETPETNVAEQDGEEPDYSRDAEQEAAAATEQPAQPEQDAMMPPPLTGPFSFFDRFFGPPPPRPFLARGMFDGPSDDNSLLGQEHIRMEGEGAEEEPRRHGHHGHGHRHGGRHHKRGGHHGRHGGRHHKNKHQKRGGRGCNKKRSILAKLSAMLHGGAEGMPPAPTDSGFFPPPPRGFFFDGPRHLRGGEDRPDFSAGFRVRFNLGFGGPEDNPPPHGEEQMDGEVPWADADVLPSQPEEEDATLSVPPSTEEQKAADSQGFVAPHTYPAAEEMAPATPSSSPWPVEPVDTPLTLDLSEPVKATLPHSLMESEDAGEEEEESYEGRHHRHHHKSWAAAHRWILAGLILFGLALLILSVVLVMRHRRRQAAAAAKPASVMLHAPTALTSTNISESHQYPGQPMDQPVDVHAYRLQLERPLLQ